MLNLEENMKNTYRACAEINLDALKHNIQEIQAVLGDTKLMCVIKTNAYGHGSIVLARELAALGAYGFAVATVDEGLNCEITVLSSQSLFSVLLPKNSMQI